MSLIKLSSLFLLTLLLLRMSLSTDESVKSNLSEEHIPLWGAKKARTVRYEVSNAEVKPTRCDICRPNCPHWVLLGRKKRNVESAKWYLKNKTKEEMLIYRKNHGIHTRKWYSKLSKESKEKINQRSKESRKNLAAEMTPEERMAVKQRSSERRKRRLESMTEEERRAWYTKNNSYSRKQS
jgi:hypothetical protein